MIIVRFEPGHLKDLCDVIKSNHISQIRIEDVNLETLPQIGYIAFEEETPVAVGFLRLIEGGIGQIDTLTTNSSFNSEIRHIGISKVVDSIINQAKSMKLKGIISLTNDKSVILRAQSLGFRIVNQSVIALQLF